jgi:DNA (cytosine-5)-methyltransferase 1
MSIYKNGLLPGELVVDNYCGGGGASTGLEMYLKCKVDIAINHNKEAIDMHQVNHPETKHYCESVWDVDPVKACSGSPVGVAWFSPDCTHFSIAKGGMPVSQNIRGLAWLTVKWCALVPVRTFHLENVQEFKTWGPVKDGKPIKERKGEYFNGFIKALTTGLEKESPVYKDIYHALFKFNYDINYKLSLYKKIKAGLGYDLEHKVLKICDYGVPTIRKRFFMTARNDGQPITWPKVTHGDKNSDLLPYKTVADHVIDWSLPAKSIFNRKRPLAEKTMQRIAKGIQRFVIDNPEPYIIKGEIAPFITECANGSRQRNMAIDEPLRTICAKVKGGHFALVTSYIVKMRGTNLGHKIDEPLHTISAGGNHFGEVKAFLIKYYGKVGGQSVLEPLHTVRANDCFGLVLIKGEKYQIVDIALRMLAPHELYAAHDFPTNYKISHNSEGKKNTIKNQVARVGNSVPPTMAGLIAHANLCPATKRSIAA